MKVFNMIENLSVVFLEDENNHKTLKGLPWYWGKFYLMTFYAYLYLVLPSLVAIRGIYVLSSGAVCCLILV